MKVCKLIRRHSFKDVRVFEKEAISLKKLGYDVTIVAGKKNGKVFGPDRKPVSDSAFKNAKFVYQNINFLTYDIGTVNQFSVNQMIKALEKNTQNYFVDKLYQKALSTNADIYHAHELHALYDAVQIKRTLRKKGKKVKVIFDAHELEANSKLMSLLMKEVDHLITVSDSIKEIYQKRYPNVPATVIYNSPNFQEDLTSKDHYFSNSFVVAYEGVVTYQKGDPRKIINIANLCKKAIKNFRFEIFGYVYPGLKEKNAIEKHPYINCKWIDYHDLPKELSKVHAGYIYFDISAANRKYAMPNKFFSYLNNGIPVVVNQSIDMKRFIEKHQCGIVINKTNPSPADYFKEFYRLHANRKLLRQMSENARQAMRDIYCWEKMEERLAEVYNSLK